jgi:hypothetical protein
MQRFPAGIESILENADSLSLEKLNDGTIRDTMLSGTFYPIDREVNRIIDDVKNTFKNVVCKCDGKLSDDEDYHKEIYDDIVKELTDIESKISKISDADESVYDLTINEFRIKFAITSMVLDKLYGYISSISSVDDMLNTERDYVPNITKAIYYELCNFNTNMTNISKAIKSLVSTIDGLTDEYEKNEFKGYVSYTKINEKTWGGIYHKDAFQTEKAVDDIMEVVTYEKYKDIIKSINSVSQHKIKQYYINENCNYIVLILEVENRDDKMNLIDCMEDKGKIIIYGNICHLHVHYLIGETQ